MAILAFDIDGCIVEDMPSDKIFEAAPKQDIIDLINKLYYEGNTIYIYTSRGMRRLKGQEQLIPTEYYEKTKAQLDKIGLKYHYIIFGKPAYDVMLCDKAYNINDLDNFKKAVEKTKL